MRKEYVDLFMLNKGKCFKPEHQVIIREKLEAADDGLYPILLNLELKDPAATILLALVCLDRFYIGDIWLGVFKVTIGWWLTFYIWPLYDLFTTYKKTKKLNYEKITIILNDVKNENPTLPYIIVDNTKRYKKKL